MTPNPTPELSERDRRTLELAGYLAKASTDAGHARTVMKDLTQHLAAPQPPSSPATADQLAWQTHYASPATEQREGEPAAVRVAAQALLLVLPGKLGPRIAERIENLRTALAAPSPAVDAGVERDAARYRWLRESCNHKNSEGSRLVVNQYGSDWDAQIDAALAAMKETR